MTNTVETRRREPFGSPDGSNANLQDLLDEFIDIDERGPQDSLRAPATDHSARLIIGRMGVGKTVYLRRFRAAADDDDALYADHVRDDIPSTGDIVRTTQLLLEHEVDETWCLIWRRAVCRAAISHVLRSKHLRDREMAHELAEELEPYSTLSKAKTPRSIYDQVQDIITEHTTAYKLRAYLKHSDWGDIENHLGEALATSPPICFYLDSVDDQFSKAPMYWLKCQRGLMSLVMALLKEQTLRRIHVVACLREVVYSDALRGTNAGRVRKEPHIRILDWDHPAIRHFLQEKLARLEDDCLLKPAGDHPIERWLGKRHIQNTERQTTEQLEDYLLRHTRLIPRDVVTLGNMLAQEVGRARQAGQTELSDERIRNVVGAAARGYAQQQLAVCADQIAADLIPEHAARHGYDNFYTGRSEYGKGAGHFGDAISKTLVRLISSQRQDRTSMANLVRIEDEFAGQFDNYVNLLDVLWQNGLLGYDANGEESGRSHFYSASGVDDFTMPRDKDVYAFHPCLAHKVELAASGPPIRGFAIH